MPDSSWSIRRATAEDGEFLVTMPTEAVNWSPERKPKSRRRILSDPRTAHYIAGWPREDNLGVIAERAEEAAIRQGGRSASGARADITEM